MLSIYIYIMAHTSYSSSLLLLLLLYDIGRLCVCVRMCVRLDVDRYLVLLYFFFCAWLSFWTFTGRTILYTVYMCSV